jgi:transcriptional regulator with XRE-family HTH domain
MKASEAKKVLQADLANILKKVAAGKTLTAREREIVEQSGSLVEKPLTWKALAERLGISPVTLWEWRKQKDAPTNRDVGDWETYKERRETLGTSNGKFTAEEIANLKGSLLSEKTKREKAERRLKELQLEREEQGWVPFEEAEFAVARILEPLSSLLENCPKAYAMRMNPQEPAHAEEMLTEMVDDFKKQIAATRGKKIGKRKGVK